MDHTRRAKRKTKRKVMHQEIATGSILIAMPMLQDPNFRQTVVLICEHSEEGSLGLVMNRPTEVEVSALLTDLPDLLGAKQVYTGGPVAKDGMLILCQSHYTVEGHPILNDIFLAKDIEVLKNPDALGPGSRTRCYLGYAGWAEGQLEAELKSGAWRLIPGDPSLVFEADTASIWQDMMRKMGGEWTVYATMPPDPSLN